MSVLHSHREGRQVLHEDSRRRPDQPRPVLRLPRCQEHRRQGGQGADWSNQITKESMI